MDSGNVRKGITQAHFNEEQANIVYGELALISIVAGIYFQSWYVGGGSFIGLIILMVIPLLNIALATSLAAAWGGLGYIIGQFISPDASYVIAALAFL